MDWLGRAAERSPDAPALVTRGETLTFARLDGQVDGVVEALLQSGVRPGDRVALWGGNDLPTVRASWAVPRLGAVLVPLHTRLSREELRRQVEEAGVTRVVGGEGASDPGVPVVPIPEPGEAADPFPDPPPFRGREPGEVHSILFTSGSSGRPRGVLLTRANLEASAAASAARLGNGPEDAWLAVLPLYHVGGLSILWRSARGGGTVVLEPEFDPARTAEVLRGEVSIVSLVPTMLHRLLGADPGPFRGVRAVLVGGGPAPVELVRRGLEAGLPVLPTYGMTETASQVVTMPPGETARRPGSAGTALPGVELRVREGDGPGEIEVRGPMVSPGYLREPPRPPGSWFRTGDLGRLDEEGYLTVLGRLDQAIVTGGEQVHPAEVEEALSAHPAVAGVAVYGEDDPEWGRVVTAAVVQAVPVEAEELEAFLRRRLAGFKVPKRWRFVESLPRASLGKLDRADLGRDREEG